MKNCSGNFFKYINVFISNFLEILWIEIGFMRYFWKKVDGLFICIYQNFHKTPIRIKILTSKSV